jgi:ubiquinone/menaquinone biosynthesis C-methylase UbiE
MRQSLEKVRYARLAPFYDLMEWLPEQFSLRQKRRELFSRFTRGLTLEIGVGTGKNLAYYPGGVYLVAADIAPEMIQIARRKSKKPQGLQFVVMNAEDLAFKNNTFYHIVSTFVFCSVTDPIRGLKELCRVVRPEGKVLFLEHVRPGSPILGWIFDILNPIIVRMMGANINRRTVKNIRRAGFEIIEEKDLWKDIVKLIIARPGSEK